jgi:hypothetical protein
VENDATKCLADALMTMRVPPSPAGMFATRAVMYPR